MINKHTLLISFVFALVFVFSGTAFSTVNLILGADPRQEISFKESSGIAGYYSSGSIFYLGAEYESSINDKLSYTVGGTYSSRSIIYFTYTSGGVGVVSLNGKGVNISHLMIHSNLYYKVLEPISVFGGLNYPFPMFEKGTSGVDASLSGNLGYQFGLNVRAFDFLQAELMYQYAYFSGKNNINGASITQGELGGTGQHFVFQLKASVF